MEPRDIPRNSNDTLIIQIYNCWYTIEPQEYHNNTNLKLLIPPGTHWYPRHTSTNPMDISRNSKDTLIIQLPTSQPVMVIVCSMTYKSFCVERKACQWSSSTNGVWRWYLTGKRFSNIGIRQFVVCIARLRWNFHPVCQGRRLFNRDKNYCLEKYHQTQDWESLSPC